MKQALFDAGAGCQGNYDRCSWEVLGEGQFRPLEGSHPHIGQTNKVEKVQEWRLETRVSERAIEDVVRALKLAHPYEEPAYEVIPCLDI